MTVIYKMSAIQFIQQIVFPYCHPQAQNVKVSEQRNLPQLASDYQQRMRTAIPMINFSYDAALIAVTYSENGQRFIEKIVTVIEDYGQTGLGLWGNKETFFVRTPIGEYEKWEPVFSIIRNSIQLNPQWLAGEIHGQLQRSQIVIDTQRELARIDREITAHRQRTNAEINNDMFLTLNNQEEYINPYTNKVEVGSNQWQQRWINPNGDVVYSSETGYDPNNDVNLNMSGFKLTPARKRFPEN